jgi:hypothetical protein
VLGRSTLLSSAMPRRSNDFQRVVFLIRHAMADGATVTESMMMRDRITKTAREVDIVIAGTLGSHRVVVSVECRDHERVADVSWVEQMKAKHERLNTNALVLCSRAGFSAEARRVAEAYGIECFALEDVESANVTKMLGEGGALWAKSATTTVEKVKVDFDAFGELAAETLVAGPDNLLYSADETELGPIRELVEAAVRSEHAMRPVMAEATEEHKWLELTWERPVDSNGNRLWMKKVEPFILRPVERIRIAGPFRIDISKFGMRHGRLGDVFFAWGKGNVYGREAIIVASALPSGAKKLSLSFGTGT